MILDSLLTLSDAQALTGTAVSTNVADLSVGAPQPRQIGEGEPLGILFTVDVAADVADGNETYQFEIQTDDASNFPSQATIAVRAIPRATLVAGYTFVLPIPMEAVEQFIRANYTLGGTTPTITVTAQIQPLSMLARFVAYNDAITIS
jgi:hypothetical protein